MPRFRFLHAADLHLDSPLVGLAKKSAAAAARVEEASRRAFDALVDLAIAEDCAFVLIAGDLFDGEWRHYGTGVHFAGQMAKLAEAGIAVFVIFGNHDAENRFLSRLDFSDNVRRFASERPQTHVIETLDVAVHGQSFARRDVTDNLAAAYPPPIAGAFNIGLLHTACGGREGHASYAPCTVEQLRNHGYDYWALGHVHTREVLCERPAIVFPGNIQGRNPRERGPKGATLVTVEDGAITDLVHRDLDVLRFHEEAIDVAGAATSEDLRSLLRAGLTRAAAAGAGRPVALRLRLVGAGPLHDDLSRRRAMIAEEVETLAAADGHDLWLEKLVIATSPPTAPRAAVDAGLAGRLRTILADLVAEDRVAALIDARLAALESRIPEAAHRDDLLAEMRREIGPRAVALARATSEGGVLDDDAGGDAAAAAEAG